MKSKISLATVAFPLLFSLALKAQTPTPTPSPGKQANRPIPFHGMVSAIDQKNKTFTISGKEATRVFKVNEKTVITKGAGNAKFTDIVENQEVSGAYWRNADGSLEAKMIKLGPTEKKTTSPDAKILNLLICGGRFYGDVQIRNKLLVFAVARFFVRLT